VGPVSGSAGGAVHSRRYWGGGGLAGEG
jgi:hypothetical protein